MRILYVLHTWHPEGKGGTEMHAHAMARALARKGHQLGVFSRTGRPDRPEYEITTEWEGPVSITRINNTFRDVPNFEWIYRNRHVHEAFEKELAEFKPDLVHIHHLTGLSTTIIESMKARGLPVVLTLHDFWTVCPRGQRMTRDLKLCESIDRRQCYSCLGGLWPHIFGDLENERLVVDLRGRLSPAVLAEWDRHMSYVLNLCDVLVAPSAFHRERMLDFPLDPERIVALPHGLDHAPFDGRFRPASPPARIGFIGSVIPVKGVHILVEAFRRLGRPELSLEIHGEIAPFHDDRTYGERLRELAKGLPNVHFHGPYDAERVGTVLEGIDVLVVPSLWWETYCLTIREGLLAGIPVLASDLGAMREALDGERDGILFRAGDPDDLKEKLELLLDDAHFRTRFYNRGASVKTLDQGVEETEDVYLSAVKSARRRTKSLVVAPPSFPSWSAPGVAGIGVLPWDRVGVTVRQQGPAAVSVATRLPTQDRPAMGVQLQIREGDRVVGAVDLDVDLGAFAEAGTRAASLAAAQAAAAKPPVVPDASAPAPAPAAAPEPIPEAAVPEAAPPLSPATPPVRPLPVAAAAAASRNGPRPEPVQKAIAGGGAVRKIAVGRKSRVRRQRVGESPLKTVTWKPPLSPGSAED